MKFGVIEFDGRNVRDPVTKIEIIFLELNGIKLDIAGCLTLRTCSTDDLSFNLAKLALRTRLAD